MKAELTISQVYYNHSLLNYFFRTQAENTFNELCERAKDLNDLFDEIENLFDDLDEFEETCYNDSIDEIINQIGSEYFEDDEEEEDC